MEIVYERLMRALPVWAFPKLFEIVLACVEDKNIKTCTTQIYYTLTFSFFFIIIIIIIIIMTTIFPFQHTYIYILYVGKHVSGVADVHSKHGCPSGSVW